MTDSICSLTLTSVCAVCFQSIHFNNNKKYMYENILGWFLFSKSNYFDCKASLETNKKAPLFLRGDKIHLNLMLRIHKVFIKFQPVRQRLPSQKFKCGWITTVHICTNSWHNTGIKTTKSMSDCATHYHTNNLSRPSFIIYHLQHV